MAEEGTLETKLIAKLDKAHGEIAAAVAGLTAKPPMAHSAIDVLLRNARKRLTRTIDLLAPEDEEDE